MLKIERPNFKTVKKYKNIALKKASVKTPLGEFTAIELKDKLAELPFDAYQGDDDYMGKTLFWHLPTFTEEGCKNIAYIIKNIDRYWELKTEIKQLISQDLVVQWHLIFILICGSGVKEQFPPFADLPNWNTSNLLCNKKLFQALVNDGAKYKHYLCSAYRGIDVTDLENYLSIFGNEAIVPLRKGLDLFSHHLVSDRNDASFTIVKMLLFAGANINNRLDDNFNNTVLHYLAALEDSRCMISLIELVEKMTNVTLIDYTLQDKLGKTILFLAVGLGLEKVVDLLLKLHKEKKRDIGLNISDNYGRTPVMVAAALGYGSICRKLIEHGADCLLKDRQQQDFDWYKNAPIEEIRSILRSLSVNPERGYYCKLHSYLYSDTNFSIPWVIIDSENKEHLLVLSAEEKHFELLKFALYNAEHGPEAEYIAQQLLPLTEKFGGPHYKKSIADRCKENQIASNKEINSIKTKSEQTAKVFKFGEIYKSLSLHNNLSPKIQSETSSSKSEVEEVSKLTK